MSRNNHSSILRDIPSCLLRSLLHYETTESTKIDIFLLTQRSLYLVHESFNHGKHRFAIDASSGRYFLYDFRFSPFFDNLKLACKDN